LTIGIERHARRRGGGFHEHGNFIVNDGNATARDVLELIAICNGAQKTSVELIYRRKSKSSARIERRFC